MHDDVSSRQSVLSTHSGKKMAEPNASGCSRLTTVIQNSRKLGKTMSLRCCELSIASVGLPMHNFH